MPLAINDIVYRNTTVNYTGKGSPLTSTEGDQNEYKQAVAIVDLQTQMAAVGAGIDTITQPTANTLLITLTDATVFGPFTLPSAPMNGRGEWLPNVNYAVNDLIFSGNAFYIVEVAHTSAATFDPGATDGNANDLYGLVFDLSASGAVLKQAASKVEANTTHTITDQDLGAVWNCTNAAGCAITIPNDTTYSAPIDTEVSFRQGTIAGVLTFAGAGGVTFDVGIFQPQTQFKGAIVTVKKIAANSWWGWGYLAG
jgi:hypothetical protein